MSDVSRTAGYVALYRALESVERRRPRLFSDPYAPRFLPWSLRLAVQAARLPGVQGALARFADVRAPGARTSAIARTAYIDDVVRRALASGISQLVILGAGYDCRAQRLPELASARVFEVDRLATQTHKRALLGATHSAYVAVDFLRDDTFEQLAKHGWQCAERTLFTWEGVTNYLTEPAVSRVLAQVGECAKGTSIVFTYVHRGVIDGSVSFAGGEQILSSVRGLREPWTFGLTPEELPAFVARAGLVLREDLGADAYRARYLPRWENLQGYAFYRVALAEV